MRDIYAVFKLYKIIIYWLRYVALEAWHDNSILNNFLTCRYAMTGQLTQKSDVYSFGVILLELLTGRKPVDHTMPKGQQSLVTWVSFTGCCLQVTVTLLLHVPESAASHTCRRLQGWAKTRLSSAWTRSWRTISPLKPSPRFGFYIFLISFYCDFSSSATDKNLDRVMVVSISETIRKWCNLC